MIQLQKIYFDGKGYTQKLIESNNSSKSDLVKICSRFNFTPIDSITFNNLSGGIFCDIIIDDYYIKNVSIDHLFTDIKKSIQEKSHLVYDSTSDPKGLY